jgi:RNA polymerase sigma-70 factor (ECF subfamily)
MDCDFVAKLEPRALTGVDSAPETIASEPLSSELQAGDLAQWEQLFIRLERRCMALASRILGDSHAAADAVQEAFMRTFKARATLKEGCRVDQWLISAVGNAALDALRARRRGARALSSIPPASAPSRSSSEPGPGEQEEWLWNALAQLDEQSRLIFLLVHQEGLSYADVAAEFGWPIGTVRSKLHRARQRLRELLTEGTSP